jgi:hypothetical protein
MRTDLGHCFPAGHHILKIVASLYNAVNEFLSMLAFREVFSGNLGDFLLESTSASVLLNDCFNLSGNILALLACDLFMAVTVIECFSRSDKARRFEAVSIERVGPVGVVPGVVRVVVIEIVVVAVVEAPISPVLALIPVDVVGVVAQSGGVSTLIAAFPS